MEGITSVYGHRFPLRSRRYNLVRLPKLLWQDLPVKASDNPVVCRWRIVEADLWDRDYLDLCGPASLVVRANEDGEIAFGAMQAGLDINYGPDEIGFTWTGFEDGRGLRIGIR